MDTPLDASGHRERLRERFRHSGAAAFADHELIELLLTYAIPRKDVKPIAKMLLKKCNSLASILNAPDDTLLAIPGLGPAAVVLIRLVNALRTEVSNPGRLVKRDSIGSPESAVRYLHESLLGKREEEIHVVLLDSKNGLIAHEIVSRGTVDEAPLYPRKILETAIPARASGVLLAHNHPSGDPSPSDADCSLTAGVARALAAAGLRFLDHIIIGSIGNFSFRTMRPDLFS